jgi:ATP-dependent DNA helicase RecG
MSRPPVLFPLFAGLETLDGVGPRVAEMFGALDVTRPRDLLFVLPYAGVDRRLRRSIREVTPPGVVTVEVTVGAHFPPRRKGGPYRVTVSDGAAEFFLVYFHLRADQLQKTLPTGQRRVVSGKLELFDGIAQIIHPDHVLRPEEARQLPEFEPVYPLARTLTQRQVARAATSAIARVPDLPEWADPALVRREGWPSWATAVRAAHRPRGLDDLAAESPARERLAYDEVFAHQMTLALARASIRRARGRVSATDGRLREKVLAALPWVLTGAQTRAMDEIAADMAGPLRMNRLLQGDVGSGKTVVAFLALLIAVEAGGQGAMMAPTEILARQHLDALRPLAEAAGVTLDILTGRDRGAERERKLAELAAGTTSIIVGTHALFQSEVAFSDLRLAVIDEQHRFGVEQRLELGNKGALSDVLVMTATPIPRSLALATHGDMDVSVLDEKPPGRKPVKTVLVSSERYDEVVARLRDAIATGARAYWVCPLVAESEVVDLAAAEARFQALRSALGEGVVGLVHGQMAPTDKHAAMSDFVAGRKQLLVATTVIEVGVNVPEATIMVVERADTFGLAQLHQLRGRVGRGAEQSTCLLMYQPPLGDTAARRLGILRETEDGFRIAEEDLSMRGAGDLIGTAQSGLPRFRIADLERQGALMAMAQSDARACLSQDGNLSGTRGQAVRTLLWLMEQDRAIRLISVG